jgi:uncharacterized membrane protein YhaH (DUF805 family)
VNWFLAALKNYAGFDGRARRTEYWMYTLIYVVILVVLEIIGALIKTQIITGLYVLALLIPSLAVAVRRMHDIGKSGWWILVSLIPIIGGIWMIVLAATPGQSGSNQYGPDPKLAPAVA